MSHNVPDDRSRLLTMLSTLGQGLQHAEIQEDRVEGIGERLTQSAEFRRWSGSDGEGGVDGTVLFCYGGPGAGKTFISSLVVDKLRDQARRDTAVTSFYFDFAVRTELSATAMLGSMLKQMIDEMKMFPEGISQSLKEEIKIIDGHQLKLTDIVRILQIITSSQPTFICVDGLDGCVGAQRVRILDSLKQILDKSLGTRIFLTGRPQIRAEIEERLPGRVASVSVYPSKDEIITYLHARLAEDETPDAMDESLVANILDKIPENIAGMFLLASLSIGAILHEPTINLRRERLQEMPDGLGLEDAYGAVIERIKAEDENESRLGMEALMWISHAERPLTADELCHALAIKLGSMGSNADNAPTVLNLLGCCRGLITVDKDTSTVRLIHHTLQEYLSIRPDMFTRPHSAIAETCLTYLTSEEVMTDSYDDSSFLEYCSLNWGIHAKRELSDCSRSLALQMFQEYDSHTSVEFLLQPLRYRRESSHRSTYYSAGPQFSGLDCASFFGIAELVTSLIKLQCYDIRKGLFYGNTPLIWAAQNGHEEVVRILLECAQADPNQPDEDSETPLSHAARNGHDGVVRILLALGTVDSNHRGHCSMTPLMHAAQNGHQRVVKLLLKQKDIDPDQGPYGSQTPLGYAAKAGHEGVVKTLLKRKEVNPDRPGDGRRPLSYAAQNGHERVVKLLLQQQAVCPDIPYTYYGRTPLSYAAERGHEGVVECLLQREEVNPDRSDKSGRTPLSYAAWCGREEVVQMLLQQERVNPDRPSHDGQTPLSYAVQKGYERVVRMLLEQRKVNPNKSDNHGKTPLLYATLERRLSIMELLLRWKDVNPNNSDHNGQSPLAHAAEKGYVEEVRLLLGQANVDPNKQSHDGSTALMQAAFHGHEEIAKALLKHKETNPDLQDIDGITPLQHASSNGHEGLVKILLGRKEVNPNKRDHVGITPLRSAAQWGHDGVVKMLLQRGDVTPDQPDDSGQTPLMLAYRKGHKRVIELLEAEEAADSEREVKRRRHNPPEK